MITEDPSFPGKGVGARIVLGAGVCPDCAGLGILPPDPEVDGSEAEVCGRCSGDRIDPDQPGLDVTPSLEALVIEIAEEGAVATVAFRVDLGPVDFHMDTVTRVVDGVDPLEGLTAKDLERLVVSCPMGKKMGEHLLEHLRARTVPGP